MHLQEAVQLAVLCLLHLQLAEESDEPLKGTLVTVDPEEVNLHDTVRMTLIVCVGPAHLPHPPS